MNYEIKIDNAMEEKGTIDLHRLALIADSIRKVSEGALQIRLRGVSLTKGRKKISLKDALKVSLTSIKEGSTVLCLESEKFEKTLEPYQTDLFRWEAQQELPQHTPMTLFIRSFQDAMNEDDEQDLLDKPLLRELKHLKNAFLNDNETFIISNQNSVPELKLTKNDFKKIKVLEDEIPEPESVILNGIVESLKYSKLKVQIKTEEGIVDGFLSDKLSSEDIAPFWERKLPLQAQHILNPVAVRLLKLNRFLRPVKEM